MSGEERLNEFLQSIEDWKDSKYLVEVNAPKEIVTILNADYDDMKSLTSEECNIYSFRLYAYAEYIETQLAKEKNALEWADSSIWFIIGSTMNQYGDGWTKWQQKYFAAVKENPLASEILKVKNHAEARVRTLEGKNSRIIKMAEILTNMARRKQ